MIHTLCTVQMYEVYYTIRLLLSMVTSTTCIVHTTSLYTYNYSCYNVSRDKVLKCMCRHIQTGVIWFRTHAHTHAHTHTHTHTHTSSLTHTHTQTHTHTDLSYRFSSKLLQRLNKLCLIHSIIICIPKVKELNVHVLSSYEYH